MNLTPPHPAPLYHPVGGGVGWGVVGGVGSVGWGAPWAVKGNLPFGGRRNNHYPKRVGVLGSGWVGWVDGCGWVVVRWVFVFIVFCLEGGRGVEGINHTYG